MMTCIMFCDVCMQTCMCKWVPWGRANHLRRGRLQLHAPLGGGHRRRRRRRRLRQPYRLNGRAAAGRLRGLRRGGLLRGHLLRLLRRLRGREAQHRHALVHLPRVDAWVSLGFMFRLT